MTIREKIINKVKKVGKMNKKIATSIFKDRNSENISNSVMRRVRELKAEGLLKSVGSGEYIKTKKFDKKFN